MQCLILMLHCIQAWARNLKHFVESELFIVAGDLPPCRVQFICHLLEGNPQSLHFSYMIYRFLGQRMLFFQVDSLLLIAIIHLMFQLWDKVIIQSDFNLYGEFVMKTPSQQRVEFLTKKIPTRSQALSWNLNRISVSEHQNHPEEKK